MAKSQLSVLLPRLLMAIFIFLYLMKISMSKTHQVLFPGRFVKWNVIKHHTVGKHWIFILKSSVKYFSSYPLFSDDREQIRIEKCWYVTYLYSDCYLSTTVCLGPVIFTHRVWSCDLMLCDTSRYHHSWFKLELHFKCQYLILLHYCTSYLLQ